jgi:hypothetical protein
MDIKQTDATDTPHLNENIESLHGDTMSGFVLAGSRIFGNQRAQITIPKPGQHDFVRLRAHAEH